MGIEGTATMTCHHCRRLVEPYKDRITLGLAHRHAGIPLVRCICLDWVWPWQLAPPALVPSGLRWEPLPHASPHPSWWLSRGPQTVGRVRPTATGWTAVVWHSEELYSRTVATGTLRDCARALVRSLPTVRSGPG